MRVKRSTACKDQGCILFVLFPHTCVGGKNLNTPYWSSIAGNAITRGGIGVLWSPFYICGNDPSFVHECLLSNLTNLDFWCNQSCPADGMKTCSRNVYLTQWLMWYFVTFKASELVPSTLFPHWNSMWFFARGSPYDTSSLGEVRFTTLCRQSSNTSRILKLVRSFVVIDHVRVGTVKFPKSWLWTLPCLQKIHHFFFSRTWSACLKYLPEGCPYMLMYSALHIRQ